MSTLHDKTHCVVCSAETRSDLQMQCNFRAKYWRAPQSRPSICKWHKQFVETVGVVWQTGYGDASSSPEDVERIPESFARSLQEYYIRMCSHELHIPRPTVCKVLHTGLRLQACTNQTVQDVRPNDFPLLYAFAKDTVERLYEDNWFLKRLAFTDGALVHVRHNVTAWSSGQPHVLTRPETVCLPKNTPVTMELQFQQPAVLCEWISV